MRLRIAVCGTRWLVPIPSAGAPVSESGASAAAGRVAPASRRRSGALPGAARSTSSTVMRPAGPVPRIADASSPRSPSRRRTAGLKPPPGARARRGRSGGPGRRGERRGGRDRLDAAEQLTGGDLLLLVLDDLAQHARAGRGDFDGDLVGLDLDERLVLGDALADLLEPAQDLRARAFGLLRGSPDFDAAAHRKAHRLASHCMDWVMRPTSGSAASSSTGLWGLGMSGMASRSIGASRLKKLSCARLAAISAPKPAVRLSSCTMRQRWVFSTEACTAALSQGDRVRRSSSSTSTCERAQASSQRSTMAPQLTTVSSVPARSSRAWPKGTTNSLPG